MPFADLMLVGLKLMLLGMGIVFSFLIVLVFALKGMSRLAGWLAPEIEEPALAGITPRQSLRQTHDEELVAVISAAVARFRSNHHSKDRS